MDYVLLSAVNPTREDWNIRVRICRMWESVNLKSNDVMSLDMVLLDEQGNMMHATIRKNQISKYKHLLQESHVYVIKNFKVAENNGQYQPIEGDYKMFFLRFTAVRKIQEEKIEIPKYKFQFSDFVTLESRANDNRLLSDVIGCLSGISGVEVVGMNKKKREIEIITKEFIHTKITLWGKLAENFDCSSYQQNKGPFILIATSTSVKKFKGEIGFSATGATRLYSNLEIPEVQSMIECFSDSLAGIDIVEKETVGVPLEDQMFENRMSLKELLEKEWDSDIEEQFVTVRATIIDIDPFFGWSYVSCNVCNKKMVSSDGLYVCDHCNKQCKYSLVKFKIHLKVADKTASSTFVLFNMDAEKLLDTSAHKLLNRQAANSDSLPIQIRSLCDKNFIFKLKLNSYNIKEGFENFSISRLYEPDEKLEIEYEGNKKGKVVDSTVMPNTRKYVDLEADDEARKKMKK